MSSAGRMTATPDNCKAVTRVARVSSHRRLGLQKHEGDSLSKFTTLGKLSAGNCDVWSLELGS